MIHRSTFKEVQNTNVYAIRAKYWDKFNISIIFLRIKINTIYLPLVDINDEYYYELN